MLCIHKNAIAVAHFERIGSGLNFLRCVINVPELMNRTSSFILVDRKGSRALSFGFDKNVLHISIILY